MSEWLVLAVLLPAILIPVVLLLAYAGCDLVFTLRDPTPLPPMIDRAEGTSVSTILLGWQFTGAANSFEIRAARQGSVPDPLIPAPTSPFEIAGLEEGSTYELSVRAVFADGEVSPFGPVVLAATRGRTFDFPYPPGVADDAPGAEGLCLIVRIEPARLSRSGTSVAITLVGPAAGTTSIDRIYISQPAAAGDPYDAAGDLTAVFDISTPPGFPPIVLQAGETRTLPLVNYNLDEAQPLLVAFDITGSPPAAPSTVRFLAVQPQDAGSFTRRVVEAAVADRQTGFSPDGRIFLVSRIDV